MKRDAKTFFDEAFKIFQRLNEPDRIPGQDIEYLRAKLQEFWEDGFVAGRNTAAEEPKP